MKQFMGLVVAVLTVAVLYCAWRQGVFNLFAPAPVVSAMDMQVREEWDSPWIRQVYAYEAQRDQDWRRWRNYDAAYQRGLAHSGLDDIDESVVATYGLGMAAPQLTPPRWRARWNDGAKWCEDRVKSSRRDDPGEDEERIGRSGPKPGWLGGEEQVENERL